MIKSTKGGWMIGGAVGTAIVLLGGYLLREPGAGRPPVSPGASLPSATGSKTEGEWLRETANAKADGFAALIERALDIPDPAVRKKVARAVAERWLNENPEGLIAWLDRLPTGADSPQWDILIPVFLETAPRVKEGSSTNRRFSEFLDRLMTAYARRDPDAAAAWAQKWLIGDGLDQAMSIVAAEQATRSPVKATAILGMIKDPTIRLGAIDGIAVKLATGDAKVAQGWAASLPAGQRAPAVKSLLNALLEKNPDDARAEFSRYRALLFDGTPTASDGLTVETLGDLASELAQRQASGDPAAALRWAQTLPSAALQQSAMVGAVAGWASREPREAGEFALRQKNADAAEAAFEAWAAVDPGTAALELEKISDPALREAAESGVIDTWDDRDGKEDLGNWANELPAGEGRDAVNATLAKNYAEVVEGPAAWKRSLLIESPTLRAATLRKVVSTLADSNPKEAKALVDSAPNLPPAEVAELRRLISERDQDSSRGFEN